MCKRLSAKKSGSNIKTCKLFIGSVEAVLEIWRRRTWHRKHLILCHLSVEQNVLQGVKVDNFRSVYVEKISNFLIFEPILKSFA